MSEKDKLLAKKIGVGLVVVFVFMYIIYQLYMMVYTPVETEIAYDYTIEDTVDTEVFVAREESYITNDKKGTIISVASDGSRVAKGEEVAVVFSDTAAADTYIRLNELSESIERYKRLASQSDNYTFDIDDLNDNIDTSVMELMDVISSGNFDNISYNLNDVRDQVVTRQIATGNMLDFESKLQELQAEYDELSKKSSTHSSVVATKPGYYISGVDGLEQIVDCSKVKEYTVDDIYEVLKGKVENPPEGSIGKIVTDFTWYFLCIVDSNNIGNLEVGDKITVNLPYSSVNSVKATVYAINENTGKESSVILSCNLMNSDISSLRRENAELVIDSYSGLKISSSAIRVNEDGEKGVFVQNGNLVEFKKVNIIYSGDDFILSETDVGKDGYVKLYDNIIVEGKDLYDGKIIK